VANRQPPISITKKMRLNVTPEEFNKLQKLDLDCQLEYIFNAEKWVRGTTEILNVSLKDLPLDRRWYIKVVDKVSERFSDEC
jgi:hypothetical protein